MSTRIGISLGIKQFQLPRRGLAQDLQRLVEGIQFLGGHSTPGAVRLGEDVLDAAGRTPGLHKPHRRPDAREPMHPAIHFGDLLSRLRGRQAGDCREGIPDLALKGRSEAVPYLGETLGKRVDKRVLGHDFGS
jgi:hypothetical protein